MRVLVDMSVSLLHHGHVRLLKCAKSYGTVIVGLTADEEIFRRKGYYPELLFNARKEIIESLRYVDEVIETPWLITEDVLTANNIDALFHGSDNCNDVPAAKLLVVPRTEGISSSELRKRSIASIVSQKNRKAILSAGPGSLLAENVLGLEPCFGRGDQSYLMLEDRVLAQLKKLTGHSRIALLNGSASLALEVAVRNFVFGRVLLITTGYYGDRLGGYCRIAAGLGSISHLDILRVDTNTDVSPQYDWLVTVSTDTSAGYHNEIRAMRRLADSLSARLMVDATGSIGLEDGHELADVICYSSCKGLFGLVGASFIAHSIEPQVHESSSYLDFATHSERKSTGPYHAICSLDQVLPLHKELCESVRIGKQFFCDMYSDRLIRPPSHQPLLCTLVRGTVRARDPDVVLYQPRAVALGTSVICHLGEGHLGRSATGAIYNRISID